ncbi:unnamed protein product [Toxocara canis]|uniref:B-box type zinc finger protein ncl-1 n=1 Tax=Toxocara canis TaxID=6265 RepID=A0A183UHU1_TOXCA|nr:unnamed protein product [Toxocara canis]
MVVKCPLCLEPFREPKVLACFHSFCKPCLERQMDSNSAEKIVCPQCHVETQLSVQLGIDSLLSDYGLENVLSRQLSTDDKGLIFGSPSSTSSSPPLSDSPYDQSSNNNAVSSSCTGCKSGERASAFCQDCAHFLCANCTMAHQYMHCFEGHRVDQLSHGSSPTLSDKLVSTCKCIQHRTQTLRYFCVTCNLAICRECTLNDHPATTHQFELIGDVAEKQMNIMESLLQDARIKHCELLDMFKMVDAAQNRLNMSLARAHQNVDEAAQTLIRLIEETRRQITKELDNAYGARQLQLTVIDKKVQQMAEKLAQTIEFTERLVKYASPTEVMVFKQLLHTRLQVFLAFNPDSNNILQTSCELDFPQLNTNLARQQVINLMGGICAEICKYLVPNAADALVKVAHFGRTVCEEQLEYFIRGIFWPVKSLKIAPLQPSPLHFVLVSTPDCVKVLNRATSYLNFLGLRGGNEWSSVQAAAVSSAAAGMPPTPIGRPPSRQLLVRSSGGVVLGTAAPINSNYSDSNLLRPKHDFGGSSQSLGTTFANGVDAAFGNQYEKWSMGLDPAGALQLSDSPDIDPSDKNLATNALYPPRSQIKRHKMIYHCKFGEFGVMEGQFTEPSGVAVNAQNDIVVADTNNHRIQVFDKEGRFKFQFGECGKRDGQLLYPNRVAVNRVTGDFIVTERSPTHQIQIYNQYGQFLRKFGANILQHPRGVCVDNKGRIIVIECKVMRVIIFDMFGNILQKFSCSRYLEFPNGVCTNDKQEILISDNRAHCIKVFNYDGQFMRQIGGEGITNYPIGVGINSAGEVVVADNHNNFNLTVFSQASFSLHIILTLPFRQLACTERQDGTMLSALESKVKHAQCFDVALVEDGSVVLASKDYRLYLYRYAPN